MRILQIAPLWERVPPPGYGGTELVVSLLADGLVGAGHEVALWASGDSVTKAELRSAYPRSLRTASDVVNPVPYELVHVAQALGEARGYDIIHNHSGEPVMAMAGLVEPPMLTTMHCLITPDTEFVWRHYGGYYNTISWAQRRTLPDMDGPRFVGVAYNAIDVDSFPFSDRKEPYLLYLGRVAPEKGTHLAMAVARKLRMPLVMAGKVDKVDLSYYEREVKPGIDGKLVTFLGEADHRLKRELYRNAYCLLVPITWEEPFGLVMAEAMACGTPVVAFARGAAPEIVLHGETGLLVTDVDSMAAAVHRVDRIDPHRCRQHVKAHFDVSVMVGRYLVLYDRILTGQAQALDLSLAAPSPVVAGAAELEEAVA